jgi:hypothetical protein
MPVVLIHEPCPVTDEKSFRFIDVFAWETALPLPPLLQEVLHLEKGRKKAAAPQLPEAAREYGRQCFGLTLPKGNRSVERKTGIPVS